MLARNIKFALVYRLMLSFGFASASVSAVAQTHLQSDAVVTVTTTCEAMVPAYCQGAFGFDVSMTGQWKAGPTPDGKSRSGSITRDELANLKTAVAAALSASSQKSPDCAARPMMVPGVSELVTVTLAPQKVILRGSAGHLDRFCKNIDVTETQLFDLVDHLMRKYYPTPLL